MNVFTRQLEKEMNKKLKRIMSKEMTVMKKSLEASLVYEDAFLRLKKFIIAYTFRNENEEIKFFKEIKPRLFYRMIYHRKVYNIEMNRPCGLESQRAYLIEEIEAVNRYNYKRSDFVRYYRSELTHLDALYYLRNRTESALYLESFHFERDPLFSTNCDYKVARIMANEFLITYLTEQLESIDHERENHTLPNEKITWMDSKTDLTELIYLLDSKGCFGELPLTRLANYLCLVFNVHLDPNLSRTFYEMKNRNNPTPWIDRAKTALLERMYPWRRKKKKNDTE